MAQIKKVLANVQQSLTDAEKAQARANIGVSTGSESIYDCHIYAYDDPITGTDPSEIITALNTNGVLVRLKAILGHSGSYVYMYPYGKGSGSYTYIFYGYDDGYIYKAALYTYMGKNSWVFTSEIFLETYYCTGALNQSIQSGYTTPSFNLKMSRPLTAGMWEMLATISGSATLTTFNLARGTWSQGASQYTTVFHLSVQDPNGSATNTVGCSGAIVQHPYGYDPEHELPGQSVTVEPQLVICHFRINEGHSFSELPCIIRSTSPGGVAPAKLSITGCTFRRLTDNTKVQV